MKRAILLLALGLLIMSSCKQSDKYETVEGDPMESRIYTLDNGLKVYLTVNKDQPRIQTYIAVRVGGSNDPAETTGLSHYLEHIMFKGTTHFGTIDYEAEKPLLDEIEQLYETYRVTTDEAERKAIYHQIDSISYEASKYAVANEYDKLMAAIGSNGSNAYTSEDVTCYTEDIPANQVENWAKIQSDRFKNMVIRGFHTELETVYEEYNISLTQDMEKVWNTVAATLFPNHPYGKQTVIGTQEHLKNPSITNIKNHFAKWYVPNNVAICMSGDLDFDKTLEIIKQYFGDWQGNPNVDAQHAELENIPLNRLTEPVVKEVYGREAERLVLAWGFPGSKSEESDYLSIIGDILNNGKAGLLDIDLVQSQKVLGAASGVNSMRDFSELLAIAMPKEGQSLDDLKDLLLKEMDKLKAGEFDDALLESIINNMKLERMHEFEDNESRASMFVESFINGTDWKDEVEKLDRLSKITKQDVVDFANKYITDGYACIYKRQGIDENEKKIEKPAISPIEMNRDKRSDFMAAIDSIEVEPIEPVFVDYEKDMTYKQFDNGDELLYKKNETNGLFTLSFVINRGDKADKTLDVASDYISYLGTDKMTAEDLQKELYHLACNASISVNDTKTTISVSGLAENMKDAYALCLDWIKNAKMDEAIYANLVADILKSRADAKLQQQTCFYRLRSWGMYGPEYTNNLMTQEELLAANPQELLDTLADLLGYTKTILYYGPCEQSEVEELLGDELAATELKTAEKEYYNYVSTPQTEVYIAPYEAKNIYFTMFSCNDQKFDANLVPSITAFNEYFGGGMNAIVFQELREARGLAYSAAASYIYPSRKNGTNGFMTYIISQNDKLGECISTFNEIIEQMPKNEHAFGLAKDAILKRLATERTSRFAVLSSYLANREMGLDHEMNEDIYNKVKDMTLDDVIKFQEENVKGRTYKYFVLGDEKELDMSLLESVGPVHRLTLKDIFGY